MYDVRCVMYDVLDFSSSNQLIAEVKAKDF